MVCFKETILFQGSRGQVGGVQMLISIELVIYQGGGPDPYPPLDPHMIFICYPA